MPKDDSGEARQHGFRVNQEQYTVEIDLGPNCEWRAQMQWPEGATQGGPAVLVVHPANPSADNSGVDGGISHTLLREIDFRAAVDALRRSLARSGEWQRKREDSQKLVLGVLKKQAQQVSVTDAYLSLLARVYVGAVNQGQEKPLQYLADETGKSSAAIKNHLWQATRKGLLERSPGRAGGRITERAAEILRPLLNEARAEEGLPQIHSTGTE